MRFLSFPKLAAAALVVALAIPSAAWATSIHNFFGFADHGDGYTALRTSLKISAPDAQSEEAVYWAHSLRLDNGKSAYIGVQTKAGKEQPMFLFSVWDATDATPAAGAWCQAFGGEGVGMSCRRFVDWKTNTVYQLKLSVDATGLVVGTIIEPSTGMEHELGSIVSPGATGLSRFNHANWVELYANPPCDEVPVTLGTFTDRQLFDGAWRDPTSKGVNSTGTRCQERLNVNSLGANGAGFITCVVRGAGLGDPASKSGVALLAVLGWVLLRRRRG